MKDERETDAGLEERFFDDYRRIGDVLEPHRIEWRRNGDTFEIVVERVVHNTSIDRSVFDLPSSPTPVPPLPDIESVLATAERNEQEANRRFTDYTYSRSSASGRVDGTGRVTLVPGEAHDIFHLAGRPIARRTRKRDGQPLTDAERREEDERIEKSVREYERQRRSGETERPVSTAQPSGLVMLRMPVLADGWLPAFRRMCVFSDIRREQMAGRRVLVVEFEPRRGVAARGDFERQAAVTAGTLWIDEALQTVIRIDAYLTDDWERTVKGSSVRVERTLVNGEVWLPLRTEVSTRLQFAFGNLSQFLSTGDYSNHKKFTVSTDSTIALPDAGR